MHRKTTCLKLKHQRTPTAIWHLLSLFLVFFAMPSMVGCSKSDEPHKEYDPVFIEPKDISKIEYSFAIHPLHNPTRLFDVFQPLIDHLNHHISDAHFVLEASRDYPSFDRKLANQSVDFALPNPYQTVESLKHGYKVFAKMGDDQRFRGIILVRKDSPFKVPTDLIGHKVSYPAPTALAATMLPQYFLHKNGVQLKQLENHYVGSQESSIMNVYHKLTDAAATWPPPWEALAAQKPELQRELKVIWQTPSLPNNGLVAKQEIPEKLIKQVQAILVNLHHHRQGQKILQAMKLSKFEPATDATYQPVTQFIQTFSQSVRLPSKEE